jgi:hypothetical protein
MLRGASIFRNRVLLILCIDDLSVLVSKYLTGLEVMPSTTLLPSALSERSLPR